MNTQLTDLSSELSALIAAQAQSVVAVDARRRGAASGVLYADGVIVSSNHAIEREDGIRVALANGQVVDATLKGRDPSTDLAVLGAPTAGLPPAAWHDADDLALGALVVAVARPNNTLAATLGIIGALDEAFRTGGGGRVDRWLEPALELPRGFSGSPLARVDGRVLGVNTTGLARGRRLTLPTRTVKRVVEALLARGQVQRGFLGIGSHPIRLPAALAQQVGQPAALIVVSVQPDGPAERAGVLLGDLLLALDGRPTTDVGELVALLDEERIDQVATLKLVRAGALIELQVKVGARSWS